MYIRFDATAMRQRYVQPGQQCHVHEPWIWCRMSRPPTIQQAHHAPTVWISDAWSFPTLETTLIRPTSADSPLVIHHRNGVRINPIVRLVYVLWRNVKVLAIFTNMYQVLVPTQRLPHVECVFPFTRQACGVIAVVVDYPAEYGVSAKQILSARINR